MGLAKTGEKRTRHKSKAYKSQTMKKRLHESDLPVEVCRVLLVEARDFKSKVVFCLQEFRCKTALLW